MPELRWPGKYDADGRRTPVPQPGARLEGVELFVGDGEDRLIAGDNLLAMDALLNKIAGTVDLVYIDPPFSTGGKFSVSTRVGLGRDGKAPPEVEAPAYSDRFDGGADGFLAALDPRVRQIHALLAPHGSLYFHCDPTVGHVVKLLLDEVFGAECFQREIVWRIGWISGFKSKARNWIRNHDLIFFYVKDPKQFTFNKIYVPYPEGYTRRDGSPPRGQGMPIDDVWNANDTEFALRGAASLDSIQIKSFSTEKCGYATQKNESIARRIIEASSNPGDLVMDVFCGSGTVGVAARRLGRRFVGCDWSAAALHLAKKRMLGVQSKRGLSLERVGTGLQHWAERVRAHHGPPEGVEVMVAGPADAVGPAQIDGHRGEILARRFDLPLSFRCPPSVTLLRVSDDVENPAVAAERDAAVVELPEVELTAADGVLRLTGYRFPHPERLDPSLRAAVTTWSDLVDAWSVTWNPEPLLRVRTDAIEFRTHQQRDLNLEFPIPDAATAALVKIVDVLYQTTTVELTLHAGEITQARKI